MFLKLASLFMITTLIETWLLIEVGKIIGLMGTIALIVATSIVGGAMAKSQGLKIWVRIHTELQTGRLPGDSLVDGILILMGGCFLVTPGILTDCFGFATLIPFTRAILRGFAKRWFKANFKINAMTMGGMNTSPRPGNFQPPPSAGGPAVETDDWENIE